jgi:hypothetical protein
MGKQTVCSFFAAMEHSLHAFCHVYAQFSHCCVISVSYTHVNANYTTYSENSILLVAAQEAETTMVYVKLKAFQTLAKSSFVSKNIFTNS